MNRMGKVRPRVGGHRENSADLGAVAVLVAILATILFVMAAFAVDFGNAYSVKRKLSVSADAAALAGAAAASKALPAGSATCDVASGVILPASMQTAALTAASAAVAAASSAGDLSGSARVDSVTLACTADDIRVTVNNSQTVATFFGGVIGVGSTHPTGAATARAFVPASATGLKPIAACTSTVNTRYNPPSSSKPFLIFMDNGGNPCGLGASGNWGILNFDEQGQYGTFDDPNCPNGGSAGCQKLWMQTGYFSRVYVPNPNPFVSDPINRVAGQPGLGGSTGQGLNSDFKTAMQEMPGKIISVPVAQWVADPGNNARFGITGIITVKVCASRVQNEKYFDPSPTQFECDNSYQGPPNVAPYNTNLPGQSISEYTWWNTGNNQYAFWAEPVNYVTSGSSDPRGGCLFVSGCDLNTRAVELFH